MCADPTNPASVRRAMMKNVGEPISSAMDIEMAGPTVKKFGHLVSELFQIVLALMNPPQEAENVTAYWKTQKHIHGWEYMDLVDKTFPLKRREMKTGEACGNWPKFADDIQALILFGANFGDILLPKEVANFCANFQCLPRGNFFLAVEVKTLI